jgi:peptide/nickel transport system ATP-binding protein
MGDLTARPIVSADKVVRRYRARGVASASGASTTVAVDGVSLALRPGEVLGLVGRSGAGKSTLARLLLGLESPDEGSVSFDGRPLGELDAPARREFRRAVQVVFQDPFGSLDPRFSIRTIVHEPLAIHRKGKASDHEARVEQLLGEVGLPAGAAFLRRRPRELSGGERQRVALARALACGPRALVLDEPVSALDASVRGQVLNLLMALHRGAGLALLLVAHDITLVARCCRRVAVMAHGRIVEEGPPERVLAAPQSPDARELIAAAAWLATSPAADGCKRRSEPDHRR